jgi:hypothetical protein
MYDEDLYLLMDDLNVVSGSSIPSIGLHSIVLTASKSLSPDSDDDPDGIMGGPPDINVSSNSAPPPKKLAESPRESSQRHLITTAPRDHRPQPPHQPRSRSPDRFHVPQPHRSHPSSSRTGDWAIRCKRKHAGNQGESSSDGRIRQRPSPRTAFI